jgi:type III pantothenate kinase
MVLNLAIDIGNTRSKLGAFYAGSLVYSASYPLAEALVADAVNKFPAACNVIVSSVGSAAVVGNLMPGAKPYVLGVNTLLPIVNMYKSPDTLGPDRLAAAVGATVLFPGQPLLAIDAGTALTYELVTETGGYLGGNISPGFSMRFKALHTFTAKLPLIEPEGEPPVWGTDTRSAIYAGVAMGMAREIDGAAQHFLNSHPRGKIVLTGGDAPFFDKKLKSAIFASPDLVLIGLNRILDYTIENKDF